MPGTFVTWVCLALRPLRRSSRPSAPPQPFFTRVPSASFPEYSHLMPPEQVGSLTHSFTPPPPTGRRRPCLQTRQALSRQRPFPSAPPLALRTRRCTALGSPPASSRAVLILSVAPHPLRSPPSSSSFLPSTFCLHLSLISLFSSPSYLNPLLIFHPHLPFIDLLPSALSLLLLLFNQFLKNHKIFW